MQCLKIKKANILINKILYDIMQKKGDIMNILIISNFDDDEKLEDIWISRAFQKDGHKVAIVDKNYDERLEDIFDVFIRRNTWDSKASIENISKTSGFEKRIIEKNLPRINFDGKYDGNDNGKEYLVRLFEKGYKVIPSIDNLNNLHLLNYPEKYMLKLKNSYDGIGQKILNTNDVNEKFNEKYIIQPLMEFVSEVQFYYIKDKFQYALEFIPSKVPVYPDAIEYVYNESELKIANEFAKLNDDYYGIQRIDFIKLKDGTLLLTEIEDIAPYLDLDCVNENIRNKFIEDYKNMVYEYMKLLKNNTKKKG